MILLPYGEESSFLKKCFVTSNQGILYAYGLGTPVSFHFSFSFVFVTDAYMFINVLLFLKRNFIYFFVIFSCII